jgi:hypothetical protein
MPFDGKVFERQNLLLTKLDAVMGLLDSPDKWCRGQLRTTDGRHCIMGALVDVDGVSMLMEPILGAARELTGKWHWRVESFNDHAKTDHPLVIAVLARARENIALGKVVPARPPTAAQRVRMFCGALARLGK